ncbi:glycosyl hydrolase [Solimonas sp. K1W22B-7]|uniref:glycosyl hydrolase n=1 Tax=Solimonas sp. K1W22B-7 TaxID=2303331 RepID=UPI0019695B3A|nr:glycosyl hydrolase [Solimonas sp. K1W22B-7]
MSARQPRGAALAPPNASMPGAARAPGYAQSRPEQVSAGKARFSARTTGSGFVAAPFAGRRSFDFRTAFLAILSLVLGLALSGCQRSEPVSGERSGAEIDLVAQPEALVDVPQKYRPKFRWWWPTDEVEHDELVEELHAAKDAGFGGVELSMTRNPVQWGSTAYRHAVKAVLTEANEIGMGVDITLGPAWPISSAAVNDETKGLSSQDLVYGYIDVIGPMIYSGAIPEPSDNIFLFKRLASVSAAQFANPLDPGIPNPVNLENLGTDLPNPLPVNLAEASMIDLSDKVGADGKLQWTVPAGRWRLFGFWSRPTVQRTHGDIISLIPALLQANLPFDPGDIGGLQGNMVVDHFGRAGIDATLDDFDQRVFGGDMTPLWKKNGGFVFEDSLELSHTQPISIGFLDICVCSARFWTPEFIAEFQKRRGYDLRPLLPLVFAAYDLPGGDGARLRRDYYNTLSELFIDNHLKPIADWAGRYGLRSRTQAYHIVGQEVTRASAGAQHPDGESLAFGDSGAKIPPGAADTEKIFGEYRKIVSGAHISGAKELSLEAGAITGGNGYNATAADYKIIADRAFAAGITTMVVQGIAYRKYQDAYQLFSWPGWDAWITVFSESWNQVFPQMKKWPTLAGYLGRGNAVLQQGQPAVDLTVLGRPTVLIPLTAGTPVDGFLQPQGYSWDSIDDQSLAGLPDAAAGRVLPEGPAYKAVVVDRVKSISGVAAQRLLSFARAGVPVVVIGAVPAAGMGYKDVAAEDAQVAQAFEGLAALDRFSRIDDPAQLPETLRALGVMPALRVPEPTHLVAQHRRLPNGDLWFVYNNSADTVDTPVGFSGRGRPTRIDLWTGAAEALAEYREEDGVVTLPLRLPPGGTMVLSFNPRAAKRLHVFSTDAALARFEGGTLRLRDTSSGERKATLSDGREVRVTLPDLPPPLQVTGNWQLVAHTVSPAGDDTVSMPLPALKDWRNIPGLTNSAGTGIYTTEVDVPADWLTAGRGVLLDPGTVGGMMEVFINGQPAYTPTLPEPPRPITALLHPGINDIRVEVATTLLNRMIGQLKEGDLRYALFAARTAQPYGLIGPVRLIPYAEAQIGEQR